MDCTSSVLVHTEAELVRSAVVSNNIKILLGKSLQRQVDLSNKDTLLARIKTLHELIAPGAVDHTESTAVLGVVVSIVEILDSATLHALLGQNLSSDSDKAGTLKGDDLREARTHRVGDVTGPRRIGLTILGDWLWPDWRPAGNMHVDVLLVFVVAKEGLSVFPTVKASNADVGKLGARHDGLETLALAVAVVGALDVGWLDLAAVMNDDALLVDERLRQNIVVSNPISWQRYVVEGSYLGDVERAPVSLAVAEDNENTGLFDRGADTLHLRRISLQGVAEVLVHKTCVINGIMRPDAPLPADVSYTSC